MSQREQKPLYQELARLTADWRQAGYPCMDFPAIGELLTWARYPETGSLRYLRAAQFRALEIYWHLRLVEKTPRILDRYTN